MDFICRDYLHGRFIKHNLPPEAQFVGVEQKLQLKVITVCDDNSIIKFITMNKQKGDQK